MSRRGSTHIMRIVSTFSLAALMALVCTGCTEAQPNPAAPDPFTGAQPPSIAMPASPASAEDNESVVVKYDPCTKLGDDVIEHVGFDPNSRERNEEVLSSYAFVGCSFQRRVLASPPTPTQSSVVTGSLNVNVSTITLDDIRGRIGETTDTEIGGHEAVRFEIGDSACHIAIGRPYGALYLSKSVISTNSREGACDNITEIAETISVNLPSLQ